MDTFLMDRMCVGVIEIWDWVERVCSQSRMRVMVVDNISGVYKEETGEQVELWTLYGAEFVTDFSCVSLL